MKVLAATLLSAALFYVSQGVLDIWAGAWLAATPLLWLAYGDTSRLQVSAAAILAFACGQAYLFECYWDVLPVPVLALFAAVLSAGFAAAVLLAGEFLRRGSAWAALVAFPVFWTAFEFLFGTLSPHGTFGALGYCLVSFPAGIQLASLFGVHGVSFLICLTANALALGLRGQRRPALAGLALSLAALGFGALRLMSPAPEHLRVAALADADAWHRDNREETLESARSAAQAYAAFIATLPGVRVVAIPEGAITMAAGQEQPALAPLAQAAKDSGAMVLTGTFVPPAFNRAFAFLPDGTVETYAKRHLLVPLEPGEPGLTAGLLGHGYAAQICKDMDFPGTVRDTAGHDIRLMVVPANDFRRDGWIHARMAIMRGVENGFALLRSAFNGLATISDAQGRVLARTSTDRAGMASIVADVPLGPGPTLYTRSGDLFSWACVALSAVLCGRLIGQRRRLLRVSPEPG